MTRVVPDQKAKFDTDELFRKLSKESEVSYTGYRDRGHDERVARFQTECREGRCSLAFLSSGTSLLLYLGPQSKEKKNTVPSKEFLDFEKEVGKVHLKSRFIMNGVAVIFKGFIDLKKLDGIGVLEFDEQQAKIEDRILRDTIDQSRMRLQEFEERQQRIKQEPIDTELKKSRDINFDDDIRDVNFDDDIRDVSFYDDSRDVNFYDDIGDVNLGLFL